MFYELNTWDPLGTTPWKRSTEEPINGTFDGDIDILAQITSVIDPDAQFADNDAKTVMINANTIMANVETVAEVAEIGIPNLLPDGYYYNFIVFHTSDKLTWFCRYGRVFHPQILLHHLIANLVMFNMANVMETSNGYEPLPENLIVDSCPLITDDTAPDFYARILPLGASIVWGKGSTTGNGFVYFDNMASFGFPC